MQPGRGWQGASQGKGIRRQLFRAVFPGRGDRVFGGAPSMLGLPTRSVRAIRRRVARRESRRRTDDLETAFDIQSNEPDAVSELTVQEIIKCIQQLSPAYRSVFNLYVVEGYSHKEIADILELTESTSRSNLVKARSKLKDLLSVTFGNYGK